MAPVSGHLALMAMRLAQGIFVPVNGPGAKMSLFSGPSGSQSAGTSSYRYLTVKPAPPMKSRATSAGRASSANVLPARSMRRTLPV